MGMRDILGIAVAVVIALLTQIVQPWSAAWWTGVALSGAIAIVVAMHLAWQVLRRYGWGTLRNKMQTIQNLGINASLMAAVIALIAAFRGYSRIAVAAAILAWVGVGVDYWTGPPRTFLWAEWYKDALYWGNPTIIPTDKSSSPSLRYNSIVIFGSNKGREVTQLDDAYLLSNITGEKIHMKALVLGKKANISDLNAIPPLAAIVLSADISDDKGITSEDFLNSWGRFVFVSSYDGKDHTVEYNREQATQMVTPLPGYQAWPRVTIKHSSAN